MVAREHWSATARDDARREEVLAMYALKRIAAYAIDLMLIVGPCSALFTYGEMWIFKVVPQSVHLFSGLGMWGVSLALPVLILGTLSGLTGRTPGKWVMFLNVQDFGGDPPGIAQGILRELIKAVSLGFVLGMIWALQGVVTSRQTFYDQWLDLEVDDLRPVGLTPTQKNFRKYMREQARKQKQKR
jgi:uncharacterized RDD family membrane protein YckC